MSGIVKVNNTNRKGQIFSGCEKEPNTPLNSTESFIHIKEKNSTELISLLLVSRENYRTTWWISRLSARIDNRDSV